MKSSVGRPAKEIIADLRTYHAFDGNKFFVEQKKCYVNVVYRTRFGTTIVFRSATNANRAVFALAQDVLSVLGGRIVKSD